MLRRSRYAIVKAPAPTNVKEKGKLSTVLSGLEKGITFSQFEQSLQLLSNQAYNQTKPTPLAMLSEMVKMLSLSQRQAFSQRMKEVSNAVKELQTEGALKIIHRALWDFAGAINEPEAPASHSALVDADMAMGPAAEPASVPASTLRGGPLGTRDPNVLGPSGAASKPAPVTPVIAATNSAQVHQIMQLDPVQVQQLQNLLDQQVVAALSPPQVQAVGQLMNLARPLLPQRGPSEIVEAILEQGADLPGERAQGRRLRAGGEDLDDLDAVYAADHPHCVDDDFDATGSV